ncbi:acetyl esterase/lipase [Balneicella halophila]|uniref:Acetyl esterase/lipase n=1 Tax=Balneicella halophila TaxID=1537566 RepID=A0A7L4URY6_BALHA|nr:alpha/beta hydrolase [Balneicella halophila]PVX51977.1 acetyl esterase/lipase [Balneicella halophila]
MRSAYILLVLFNSLLFETCSITPTNINTDHSFSTEENLAYGKEDTQTLDLYISENVIDSIPMVILVHGGAWFFVEKETLNPVQEFLAKNNIPSANINYRLNKGNITYKEQLEDIDLAVNYLKEKADSLSLPCRFILFGESAGAHLSLLYGYQNPECVEKIISLAAPTDFFSETYTGNRIYHWYTKYFFELATRGKYSDDKSLNIFKEASPISNASNVPTLILQGTSDRVVDMSQALSLDSVLTKKNVPHKLVLMEGGIHVSPRLSWWRDKVIYPEMLSFLKNDIKKVSKPITASI